MHSLIIQISDRPIAEDSYTGIDHVEAGEMASIDYCDEIEQSERKGVISNLVNRTLPAGMFTINPDGETLTYRGGFTEWCRQYVRSLHDKAGNQRGKRIQVYRSGFSVAKGYCKSSRHRHPLCH